ncbi:MAG: beta-ketoacyl synthase N-terminal-like domain-containing protein [Victivallaceae bacterium]|nr:beta-ketoacyl synthase N-terminal-like domain-containing protein [Victivallaceae bacterium]
MNKRRVVITGTGVVSALGHSREELFRLLLAGKSAARFMPEWESFFGSTKIVAAPVTLDPDVAKKIDRKFRRSMGNAALFAAIAAIDAVDESGLDPEILSDGRTGCIVSSTMGSSSSIVESTAAIIEKRFDDLSACQFFRLFPIHLVLMLPIFWGSAEFSLRHVLLALPHFSQLGWLLS